MNCTPFRLFQSVGLLNVHLVGSISVADFGKIVKGFCKILSKCFRWLLSALFSKDTKQALIYFSSGQAWKARCDNTPESATRWNPRGYAPQNNPSHRQAIYTRIHRCGDTIYSIPHWVPHRFRGRYFHHRPTAYRTSDTPDVLMSRAVCLLKRRRSLISASGITCWKRFYWFNILKDITNFPSNRALYSQSIIPKNL